MNELEIEKERLKRLSEIWPDYPCANCQAGLHCTNWTKQDQSGVKCHRWWKWFSKTWKEIRKELKKWTKLT